MNEQVRRFLGHPPVRLLAPGADELSGLLSDFGCDRLMPAGQQPRGVRSRGTPRGALPDDRKYLVEDIGCRRFAHDAPQVTEETGMMTGMAGGSLLVHDEQERIAIAVDAHLPDTLHVAALLAFAPQATSGPAPIPRIARRDRPGQCLLIHIGQHEHLPGGGILGHDRHQAFGVELHFRHGSLTGTPHRRK